MNDDELGRRLHDELHRRIDAPEAAPEAVHQHLRSLRTMQEVRWRGSRGPSHRVRDLFGLAAAVAVVAVVTAGLMMRQSSPPNTGVPAPKNGIEAFGRIDSKTAWAESGSDLYVTRDGGETWSQGTVPGGKSPGQAYGGFGSAEATPVPASTATPTPILSGQTPAPGNSDPGQSGQQSPYALMPSHFYPDFIDADHGWLLSWTESDPTSSSVYFTLTVWRTSDGGQSWQSAAVPGTYKGYGLVQFVDESHGWVTVLRTDRAAADAQTGDGSGAVPSVGPEPTSALPPDAVPSVGPEPTSALPPDTTTVLESSDGGATWSPASTMASMALPHFVSQTEAWGYAETDSTAGIDRIIHSIDGGRTWSTAALPVPAGDGYTMGWPNPPEISPGSATVRLLRQTSVAAESGGSAPAIVVLSFVSTDDGRTWTLDSTRPADTSVYGLNSISTLLDLPTGQPIVVSGQDMMERTVLTGFKATFDGGATWDAYDTTGLPSVVTLAEWTSTDDAWVMTGSDNGSFGLGGQLYATHDMGKTWKALLGAPTWPASPQPTITSGITPEIVYITPEPSGAPAESTPPEESGPTLSAMGRVDAKVGWVVETDSLGLPYVRLTSDGGATWSEPRKAPPYGGSGLQFVDATHGWALTGLVSPAAGGGTYSLTMWRTADGGLTWQSSTFDAGAGPSTPMGVTYTSSFHFRDQLHGEVFQVHGDGATPSATDLVCQQLSTSDGGQTWSEPRTMPCLWPPSFVDGQLGHAGDVSGGSVMYVTTDGGQTWTAGDLPAGANALVGPLHALERESDGTLRALVRLPIGDWSYAIVDSHDDGRTWTTVGPAVGLPADASLIDASDGHWFSIQGPDEAWVSDDGLTWTSVRFQSSPIGISSDLDFVSPTDGWTLSAAQFCDPSSCKWSSSVSATSDGGATWTPIFNWP
jgi:photosystem II stability/assembly factor-like uncharacterized protein